MKIQTSTTFLATLAVRRLFRAGRVLPLTAVMAAALYAPHAARAANATHTLVTNASGNISDSTQYTGANPPSAATAGDILQDGTAATGDTLALDIPVTIGFIQSNAGGAHSDTFNGPNAFTLDDTGGTVANVFGDTVATISNAAAAGVLTINANVIVANSTLDIGSTGNGLNTGDGTVTIAGNITATTATTISLRNNDPYTSTTSGNPNDIISGAIGASGSAINLVNASTTGTNKATFTLSGAIGGATGTGAAVTIANTATGATNFVLSGALGASVSSITQNSATSLMTISGTSTGFAGTTSIQNGTLSLSSATALASSAVTLANTAGATLNVATASTIGSLAGGGTGAGNVTAATTLTTGGLNTSTTYAGAISGAGGLTKVGTGTQTLAGTNTYTGATTVSGGTLKLDFTAATAPTTGGILGNTTAGALSLGGGTLQVVGATGGSTQTFSATTFTGATGGQSVISAAPTTGGAIPTVALGTLTGTQGALVRFDGAAFNNGASSGTTVGGNTVAATANFTATTNTINNGLIAINTATAANALNTAAAYATVGLYDWAAISGAGAGTPTSTGTIVGLSQNNGYTVSNGSLPSNSFGLNIDMTASGSFDGNSTSASAAYETIRFNTNAAITLNGGRALGGASVGGLLVTPNVGAFNTTIAPQTGTGANASFQASRSTNAATGLTVWQNNTAGELVISATYTNGASSAATATYTQGGAGTVLLTPTSLANSYTGQSFLDGGATVIVNDAGLGTAATGAAVNLNGGTLFGNATLTLDNGSGANARQINLTGAGGTLAAATSTVLTVDGFIEGAGTLTIGSGTLAGTGANTANTTAIVGNGTVVLSAGNGYSGGTVLNAGTLNINGINALGGGNYAGLTFNGGTLQYATGATGNGSLDISNIGGSAKPVTINAGGATIDTNGNAVTYANAITGTGPLTIKSTTTGGSLLINGSVGSTGAPVGATVVNSGTTLGGTGTLTVASATVSGTLAPGATVGGTVGTLTLNTTSGLTLTGGLVTGISGANDTILATNNLLTLNGATLTLNGTPNGTSNYDIANYVTLSGAFAGFTAPSGYTLNYNGSSFSTSDIELDVAGVPEPGTYVGGALLVGIAGWSLRRRCSMGKSAVRI